MSIAHRALFTARSLTSFTVRRALIPATRITQTPYLPLTSQSIRKMSDLTTVLAKDAAPPAGPYSHAIKTPTAIYCSGQIPCDASGNLVEGTIGEKTAACISNLKAVLIAAGSSIERVVKVNVFLADMSLFADMNKEYEKWFTHKPARSCVAVKQLPKAVDVEIECIALP
ncbi:Endoribonuclease L-PSP-domain-containing protein [Hypoxylon fragiforme]|uniref:Endoribonuclease L-PSP-domain-containing protein n=1 Tax=Hypoxylon fragiforme TaxID=63214 RepID=UPI0020C6CAE2|nr:Endoribonuclease L-PSP-domain-containing protein [Hypoxylon fragiforme]KAI2614522.1 Endoribonuclease L-PSP-domain-containing protein [Hypoxylon fragiforme]